MEQSNSSHIMIEFHQERNFSELLNVSVAFLRENFRQLFTITFILTSLIVIPAMLYLVFLSASEEAFALDSPNANFLWLGLMYITYLTLLFGGVSQYVAIYQEKQAAIQQKVSAIKAGEVWKQLRRQLIRLWGVTFMVHFFVALASLFLFLPGIYLLVLLSIGWAVAVHEKKGVIATMNRCVYLFSGQAASWFAGLWLALVVVIVIVAFTFTQSMVWGLLSLIVGDIPGNARWVATVFISIYVFLMSAVMLFPALIYNFFYYSLLEQKEAVGTLAKIDEFGKE